MRYERSTGFRKDYKALPKHVQALALEKFQQFEQEQVYAILRLKPMQRFKRQGIWEGHITQQVVFTFTWEKDESGESVMVLRKIGGHEIYKNP